MSAIGFICLGAMGGPMVANMVVGGFSPLVFDAGGGVKTVISLSTTGIDAAKETAALLDELDPVLKTFTGNRFHVGTEPGQSQALKLLNNFLSATAMAATSEAVHFGLTHGLDMKTTLDVLNVSTGRNTATSDKFPNRILTGTFDAGFRMALMEKDVALYLGHVRETGTAREIGEVAAGYYARALAAHPEGDFTEIYGVVGETK